MKKYLYIDEAWLNKVLLVYLSSPLIILLPLSLFYPHQHSLITSESVVQATHSIWDDSNNQNRLIDIGDKISANSSLLAKHARFWTTDKDLFHNRSSQNQFRGWLIAASMQQILCL